MDPFQHKNNSNWIEFDELEIKLLNNESSCGGRVGREVASDTWDMQFESIHRNFLFTLNYIDKTKTKKKRQGILVTFKQVLTVCKIILILIANRHNKFPYR